MLSPFTVDNDNSDEETLYVDILGKGTVIITSNVDGVAVDIYPQHVVDQPLFTGWVANSDFIKEDE